MAKTHKYQVGEVVFVKHVTEYMRIVKIAPWQENGMTEITCSNPRWGGQETYRTKEMRPLTARERGG